MSKWKCEICGNEFENFHAQGFDNKIYCPLCFFKKENSDLKQVLNEIRNTSNKQLLSNTNITKYTDGMCLKDISKRVDEVLGGSDE